jgi:hypothetical protein
VLALAMSASPSRAAANGSSLRIARLAFLGLFHAFAPVVSALPMPFGDAGRKCFVTNIARGPIIDQQALIEALKDGTLQGAALDVTDPEPLPEDSELWDLENVVVTPHISGNGVAYEDRAFQVLGVNLEKREKGEQLINVVKRERGY